MIEGLVKGNMLINRVITALFLAPLFVFAMYNLNRPYFSLLIAIIVLIAAWEWASFVKIKSNKNKLFYVLIIFILMALSFKLDVNYQINFLFLIIFWWLINLIWILKYPKLQSFWYKNQLLRGLNGILVIVPTWLSFILIRELLGAGWLLFLLFLIWGADTGAYFVGKNFGKRKLLKKVSPGKTVEGVIGAIAISIVISILALYSNNISYDKWFLYIVLTFLVVVTSVVGDLFESIFKRATNMKDSGSILPGHGGILDRIDSLTSASPVFLIGCLFIENLL